MTAVLLLAACDDAVPPPVGDTSAAAPQSQVPSAGLRFVGNNTCSLVNQKPYFPEPPRTHGPPIGEVIAEMPHYHVNPPAMVQYNHDPPTSGCHYNLGLGQAPISTGIYTETITAERWVHNLEHGYIVVLYNCNGGCTDAVAALTRWFQSLPPDPAGAKYVKALVMPWPTMQARFACVSWDYYLGMDQLDIPRVQAFYNNHLDEAPEGNATA